MKLVELRKGSRPHPKLVYRYRTDSHYALEIHRSKAGWKAALILKPLPREVEKTCESELFAPFVVKPRAFAAKVGDKEVGWVEVDLGSFKDRARIWELLVETRYQRKGIGAALIGKAEEVAKSEGLRSVILETQSCNVKAIGFYLSRGYELAGFESQAYSNEDIERGDVRLEFGKKLRRTEKRARRR